MATMCDNCPFADEGPGLQLRLSLQKGRWHEIMKDLLAGRHFWCHKTTYLDGNDDGRDTYTPGFKEKICAGSIHWQTEHGVKADLIQVMERLTKMKEMEG